jgi:hypothetical protein
VIQKARVLELLRRSDLVLEERVPWSSNATFLCRLRKPGARDDREAGPGAASEAGLEAEAASEVDSEAGSEPAVASEADSEAQSETPESRLLAVYKPRDGERPLWDFPDGTLYKRELAAYRVSEALGWGLVPPTILRDGPFGIGMVQAFIPHDPNAHYLELEAPDPDSIQRLTIFDALVNNADRKSGHILQDETGALWAIDHGLTFHVEPKLRTVVWEYAGEPIPVTILNELRALRPLLEDPTERGADSPGFPDEPSFSASAESSLLQSLSALLSLTERIALRERLEGLIETARFPDADPDRRMVPWPPV